MTRIRRLIPVLLMALVFVMLMAVPALADDVSTVAKDALTTGQKFLFYGGTLLTLCVTVGMIVFRKIGAAVMVFVLGIIISVMISNPVNLMKQGVNLVCNSAKSLSCDNTWFNNVNG